MQEQNLVDFFNRKAEEYNKPSFIKDDPVCIPHQFSKKQDIEIAAFFAALLAWGTRTGIIRSCKKLFSLMENSPYDFIMGLDEADLPVLARFTGFVHRTFNATDLLYLLHFLRHHYLVKGEASLETAFSIGLQPEDENIEQALNNFYHYVFSPEIVGEFPSRTKKHIAAPFKKSACKRLNMFLRWMVRNDNNGVDFGLWQTIQPKQLVCPIDVHVARVAKRFTLVKRKQVDWQSALELTTYLKMLDPLDPVKYDYALFGLGVIEKY